MKIPIRGVKELKFYSSGSFISKVRFGSGSAKNAKFKFGFGSSSLGIVFGFGLGSGSNFLLNCCMMPNGHGQST